MKSSNLVSLLIAIGVAMAVAFTVMTVVGIEVVDESEPTFEDKIEAYGNLTYGGENFTTYHARAVAHGGIHIELDNGTVVHPHDIRDKVLTRAYWIEQAEGTAEPWPPRDRYKPWHERAPQATLLGAVPIIMLLVIFALVIVGYGLYGPRP